MKISPRICSYGTLAIRLVGGALAVVRWVEIHSSDRGTVVFLSPLVTHANTRTTHPHTFFATDPTRKGLSNRRVINLTTQSLAPRVVHCALVTRALLYTVYTSSSTNVFLISRRHDDRNRYLHTMRTYNICGFFVEYSSP